MNKDNKECETLDELLEGYEPEDLSDDFVNWGPPVGKEEFK